MEFKEAKTQFDNRKLYKYCVALANEGGGYLLLGIEDAPPRNVVGAAAFNDPVEMAAKLFQTLGFRVEIEEVLHPDGRVLVFHIPSRPLGTVYDFEGAYLMRAGEELVPMSEDRLRAIFAEGQPDWLSQPAMKACDDDRVVQLLDTQSYFDLLNLPYPVNRAGVLERFESEKLIERDSEGWTITNLGGMLFAKKLEPFERLARKAARVIVYEGTNKLKTKSDKPDSKGYAVGFRGLVEYINGLVPSNEVIEHPFRVNQCAAQLQTYKAEIPGLLAYNAALVVSDGLQAKIGSLTANQEWFKIWREIDTDSPPPSPQPSPSGRGGKQSVRPKAKLELETLIHGIFEKQNFLSLLEHFIVFEENPDTGAIHKIIAGYHQFHAVNAAIEEAVRTVLMQAELLCDHWVIA